MSWLKSLKFKRLSHLCSWDSSQIRRRFRFAIHWNQTAKVLTGLVASVCSLVALISFFGSLEQSSEENSDLSKAESLAPDLGSSDALALEFGLDAELPLQKIEDEQQAADSELQSVSLEQSADSGVHDTGVYHALGREYGDQQTSGRVEQVSGEHPIYVPRVRQSGSSQRANGAGAAWLTGEIEEMDTPTVKRAAVPSRSY